MATIAWLVPSLLEGSGGHRTILQHADTLQRHGHRCVLYLENCGHYSDNSMRKDIKRMFGHEFEDVRSGWSGIQAADMVFATIWYSARVVRDLPFPCVKAYFVQDLEAQFSPMGDGYLMAENSYRYGLHPVTIGRWLPTVLQRQFGINAHYFDFCADLDVYRPSPDIKREKAVCFIHQPEKPRRCAALGIEALGIVKHFMPDVEILLYGSKASGKVWFEHRNLGLISLADCARLYNTCAAGLCVSSTNPSRIPFEMMAAGLPVVEIHRDNLLYDLPSQAALLCEPTPESLAKGIMDILGSPEKAKTMGLTGTDFMSRRPLELGLSQFRAIVAELLTGSSLDQPIPTEMYCLPALKESDAERTNHDLAHTPNGVPDPGRLAFLPPLPRRMARLVYHRLRRWLA
jgi:O-antigen biosynthesis protein